jgi:hypothetical protein
VQLQWLGDIDGDPGAAEYCQEILIQWCMRRAYVHSFTTRKIQYDHWHAAIRCRCYHILPWFIVSFLPVEPIMEIYCFHVL